VKKEEVVGTDRRTRRSVARMVLEDGPITAAAIAEAFGISPAAVRRHLDALVADGEATPATRPG